MVLTIANTALSIKYWRCKLSSIYWDSNEGTDYFQGTLSTKCIGERKKKPKKQEISTDGSASVRPHWLRACHQRDNYHCPWNKWNKKGKKQIYDENFTIHLPWHFLRSFSVPAVNSAFFGPILGENLVRDLHPSNSPSSLETLVDIHELQRHIRISLHSRAFCVPSVPSWHSSLSRAREERPWERACGYVRNKIWTILSLTTENSSIFF